MCTLSTVAFQAEHQLNVQQPQSHQTPDLTQDVPRGFSENMSNEQLALWLTHQPGAGYLTEIAEVIRGTINVIIL